MSDRSDELTESRESRSTEDLLSETDRLLSDEGAGASGTESSADDSAAATGQGRPSESTDDRTAAASTSRGASLRGRLTPGGSLGAVFSPKAFFAFVLLFGATLFVGNAVLPFAGGPIVAFGVAFLVGLLTSRRRYLEVTTAGVAAGGVATLLTELPLAAVGSARMLFGLGAALGLAVAVAGYYFGRDLRSGLSRDIE